MMNAMPDILPIFPLSGVLLLPHGRLPLNIFEPPFVAMVDDALRSDRLIGMIQPRESGALYDVGCAGKIKNFEDTGEGRYHIVLKGVSRFRVKQELPQEKGYRRVVPDWDGFEQDREEVGCLDLERSALKTQLCDYFAINNMACDWELVDDASDEGLITCLSMACPFSPCEKQALLEAKCCRERSELFMTMLDIAVRSGDKKEERPH